LTGNAAHNLAGDTSFRAEFGAKIAEGGHMAPISTVGIATFLTVLGLGLSPLPQDSSTIFI
jgi:hypothetical protein